MTKDRRTSRCLILEGNEEWGPLFKQLGPKFLRGNDEWIWATRWFWTITNSIGPPSGPLGPPRPSRAQKLAKHLNTICHFFFSNRLDHNFQRVSSPPPPHLPPSPGSLRSLIPPRPPWAPWAKRLAQNQNMICHLSSLRTGPQLKSFIKALK